jgi:Glutamine amidotransferases class-II
MISPLARHHTRRCLETIAIRRGSSLSLLRGGVRRYQQQQQQQQQQQCLLFYTTERVVELRSGKKTPIPTLYNAQHETENCGVGLIASLKSVPSRKIVEQADEMLVRMAHRGGCGCDPASGDGSGTLDLVGFGLACYRHVSNGWSTCVCVCVCVCSIVSLNCVC